MNVRKNLTKLFIIFVVSFGVLMNAAAAVTCLDKLRQLPPSICDRLSPKDLINKLQSPLPGYNVLFPKSLTEDQIQDIEQQFPNIARVDEELSKQAVNSTYKITVSSGESFFYKVFTENGERHCLSGSDAKLTQYCSAEHEAGASVIASYISNGLIPQGKSIKSGLIYPYINIDSEKTEEIFANESPNYDHKNIYDKLTPEQRVELFISMLCDMILLNPDTHPGHFGITQDGHLISFNKEHAYFSIFTAKSIIEFSTPDNFLSESKIYKDFIRELKNHPEELENLLNDPQVQEAFLRINALTILQTERECVKKILAPLFTFIKQRVNDSNSEEQFSNDYFKIFKNISEFLAKELNSKKYFAKEEITVRDVNDIKVVTFNPKINKVRLITSEEQGFSKGARVDVIAKESNMRVAMNAGFFNDNETHWLVRKCAEFAYKHTGVTLTQTYAFPSAIQKVDNKLLSDTNNYLPALGISDSGDIKIGEVKVVWSAARFEKGEKIILDRISSTAINPNTTDAIIYYKDYKDSPDIKEIDILNSKVSCIKTVAKVAEGISNCYWLHDPSQETINEFNSLKVGDELSYSYELEAAAHPEQAGIKDSELTSFFNSCPYVVSGGQLLINNGEIDPRISKDYGREIGAYTKFGTAICLRKDGMVSLIVKPGDLPSNNFIERLKEEKCEYAISLDGGGSTTLITKDDGKLYGYNRVVSDILAVMPQCSDVLLSGYIQNL
ncbi:exported hypothetical protein [Gammaproteobacteria bacterium]